MVGMRRPGAGAVAWRGVGVGLVLAAVLAGCGSDDDESTDSGPGTTTETTTETTTGTADEPAPTSASTAPARTDGSSLPEAADGSDLAACADGNCEVLVTAFPVDITFDGSVVIPALTLESVGPDELTTLTVDAAGGTSRMTARLGQSSTFLGGDRTLVVSPVAIANGAAVVRLTFT